MLEVDDWDADVPPMTSVELARKRKEFWDSRPKEARHIWKVCCFDAPCVSCFGLVSGVACACAFANVYQAIETSCKQTTDDKRDRVLEDASLSSWQPGSKRGAVCVVDQAGSSYEVTHSSKYPTLTFIFSSCCFNRSHQVPMVMIYLPRNLLSGKNSQKASAGSNSQESHVQIVLNFKVRFSDGSDLQVSQKDGVTVRELKTVIEKEKNIRPQKMRLVYRGAKLREKGTLHDYGIYHGKFVQCFLLPEEPAPATAARE